MKRFKCRAVVGVYYDGRETKLGEATFVEVKFEKVEVELVAYAETAKAAEAAISSLLNDIYIQKIECEEVKNESSDI